MSKSFKLKLIYSVQIWVQHKLVDKLMRNCCAFFVKSQTFHDFWLCFYSYYDYDVYVLLIFISHLQFTTFNVTLMFFFVMGVLQMFFLYGDDDIAVRKYTVTGWCLTAIPGLPQQVRGGVSTFAAPSAWVSSTRNT